MRINTDDPKEWSLFVSISSFVNTGVADSTIKELGMTIQQARQALAILTTR